MTWYGWLLAAYWATNALGSIFLIGRHRDPMTPGGAMVAVTIYGLLAWGLLAVGTHQ